MSSPARNRNGIKLPDAELPRSILISSFVILRHFESRRPSNLTIAPTRSQGAVNEMPFLMQLFAMREFLCCAIKPEPGIRWISYVDIGKMKIVSIPGDIDKTQWDQPSCDPSRTSTWSLSFDRLVWSPRKLDRSKPFTSLADGYAALAVAVTSKIPFRPLAISTQALGTARAPSHLTIGSAYSSAIWALNPMKLSTPGLRNWLVFTPDSHSEPHSNEKDNHHAHPIGGEYDGTHDSLRYTTKNRM